MRIDYKKLRSVDTADEVGKEVVEDLERGLQEAYDKYKNSGAMTVDSLEDNSMEAAFAKGFLAGCIYEQERILKELK